MVIFWTRFSQQLTSLYWCSCRIGPLLFLPFRQGSLCRLARRACTNTSGGSTSWYRHCLLLVALIRKLKLLKHIAFVQHFWNAAPITLLLPAHSPAGFNLGSEGTPIVPQTVSTKSRCLDLRLDEPFEATSGAHGLAESPEASFCGWPPFKSHLRQRNSRQQPLLAYLYIGWKTIQMDSFFPICPNCKTTNQWQPWFHKESCNFPSSSPSPSTRCCSAGRWLLKAAKARWSGKLQWLKICGYCRHAVDILGSRLWLVWYSYLQQRSVSAAFPHVIMEKIVGNGEPRSCFQESRCVLVLLFPKVRWNPFIIQLRVS